MLVTMAIALLLLLLLRHDNNGLIRHHISRYGETAWQADIIRHIAAIDAIHHDRANILRHRCHYAMMMLPPRHILLQRDISVAALKICLLLRLLRHAADIIMLRRCHAAMLRHTLRYQDIVTSFSMLLSLSPCSCHTAAMPLMLMLRSPSFSLPLPWPLIILLPACYAMRHADTRYIDAAIQAPCCRSRA